MKPENKPYGVLVVGGGHAGVEAALIATRLGVRTALVTLDTRAVARMSCNPAIGGLAKGQIVREIDVLGGIMGLMTDQAGLQFKILNRSKGRAVWSPRAQVDKRHYEALVQTKVQNTALIDIVQGEAVDILESHGSVRGVLLRDGTEVAAQTVILTCGTFLNGLIHIGERKIRAGRMGEDSAQGMTEALEARGFQTRRLKTGTPPRLVKDTIDGSKTREVWGDEQPVPFSYRTQNFQPSNEACHTVKTTVESHALIEENIQRSPLFSGDIFGTGPRYCPSIEDKIHRFPHQDSHLLFLEPEWRNADQIYANGFSTSLPESVQRDALRRIPGLEQVEFFRPGYAIEYDFVPPAQHKNTLEAKPLHGLFFAGQINGTSGYEEAAGQGLIAGINAARSVLNKEPLCLRRDEAYIGVLIDDLITKDTFEPYRMFTSRAEYRILLRYSNADDRLLKKAHTFDIIDSKTFDYLSGKLAATTAVRQALDRSVHPDEINPYLSSTKQSPLQQKQPAVQILKRPRVSISHLPKTLFGAVDLNGYEPHIVNEIFSEAETAVKYQGYVNRQKEQIQKLRHQESYRLPENLDYLAVESLSNEAREKLHRIRPETLGQALRISGVSPADVAVLSVLIAR